jgi:hypothetical protein
MVNLPVVRSSFAALSLRNEALEYRKRDRGETFRIAFDNQPGGLPFCDGKRY